jgi:arsenate reductase
LLEENGIDHRYREYTEEPLSEKELENIVQILGVEPVEIFRRADKVAKEKGLTGKEPASELIKLMALHPTLIQRPIGVKGKKAVIGRPVEELLKLK